MTEITGMSRTWEIFTTINPADACRRGIASYNASKKEYLINCFGQDFCISVDKQRVSSHSASGQNLLQYTDYFFDLAVLWYLINAKETTLSGTLVKPSETKGGQIFVKGTHVLPLDAIADQYNHKKEHFLDQGHPYDATPLDMGDASLMLLPFPRVPASFVLWFGDDDFPPSAQLLFDTSCQSHLAPDVLWATATICCMIMLKGTLKK